MQIMTCPILQVSCWFVFVFVFFSSSCIKQHRFLFFLIGDESENSTSCDSRSNSELPPQWIEVNEKNVVAEEQFTAAYRHVKNAKAMRDYLNRKIEKARRDIENEVPWGERVNCCIGDYAQYMNLPFFGRNQPGDTYYFVPLNVNIFGFVNVAHCTDTNQIVKDHLYANVYKEGTAKRGGNEVASLVMKSLRHIGFMDKERNGVGGELVLCFDNCPGQNKNGMVIRLAMLLVEMSYYKKVIICFLVKGHTKKSCDRLFNLMKRNYRKRNVFSYNDLMELMKTRQCTVLPSEEKDFQDYDDFLGNFYCKLRRVEGDHIFECWKNEICNIGLSNNQCHS